MEERGRKVHVLGRARAVRNWLTWVACLQPGTMVISGPGLLPRAMSGPKVLRKLWWSVLMFVAHVITEGPVDARRLGHHL